MRNSLPPMVEVTVSHGFRPTTPRRGWRLFCPVHRGEHTAAVEELSAFGIQIVKVVFMAEEDGVNWGEVVKLHCWSPANRELGGSGCLIRPKILLETCLGPTKVSCKVKSSGSPK